MQLKRQDIDSDHTMFRDSVRRFIEKEVTPYFAVWEEKGIVDRSFWQKSGEAGIL